MLGYAEVGFFARIFCLVEHFRERACDIVHAVCGLRIDWEPPFSCVLQELLRSGVSLFHVENSVEIRAGDDRSAALDERGTHALQDLPGKVAHKRSLLVSLPFASNPGQRYPDRQLNKTIIVSI